LKNHPSKRLAELVINGLGLVLDFLKFFLKNLFVLNLMLVFLVLVLPVSG